MNKEEKYESTVRILTEFLEDNEQYGDDWSEEKKGLSDLLAEVKRLREMYEEANRYLDLMVERFGPLGNGR